MPARRWRRLSDLPIALTGSVGAANWPAAMPAFCCGIDRGNAAEYLKISNNSKGTRRSAERHLGNQGAFGRDGVGEISMLGRVDVILAAGEHRDRSAREAPAMGRRVDAARKP